MIFDNLCVSSFQRRSKRYIRSFLCLPASSFYISLAVPPRRKGIHALNFRRSRLHLAPSPEKLIIYELANPFPPLRFHHPHILTRLPLLQASSSSFRWRNFKRSCTFSFPVLSYIISNVGRAPQPRLLLDPSIDETIPFRSVNAQFRGK